jgi:hypothetical protein
LISAFQTQQPTNSYPQWPWILSEHSKLREIFFFYFLFDCKVIRSFHPFIFNQKLDEYVPQKLSMGIYFCFA